MVSVYFRLLQIINMKIFQVGAFSYWLETGFRLVSDRHDEFQIVSSDFRLLQIAFRFISDWSEKSSKLQILFSHFILL